MNINSNEKLFIMLFFSLFLTSLITVFVINYAIDPYAIFSHQNSVDGGKWNPRKQVRFDRVYYVANNNFDGLVLGSSRSELGIDIRHSAWNGLNTLNMGMPLMSLFEEHRFIMHANTNNRLKQVLVGLDFFAFSPIQNIRDSLTESALLTNSHGEKRNKLLSKFTFIVKYCLSGDILDKSINKLVFILNKNKNIKLDHTNLNNQSNNAIDVFVDSEIGFFGNDSLWFPLHEHCYAKNHPLTNKTGIDIFEDFIHYIHKNKINTHFFISPLHVRMYIGLQGIGLWDEYGQWKKAMVYSNEKIAKLYNRAPIPLWDYSIINQYNTEPVPIETDYKNTKLKWFTDSSHYSKSYGNIIQDQIFKLQNEGPGILLTSDIIDSHLQKERSKLYKFIQENTEIVSGIRKFLEIQKTLDLDNKSNRFTNSNLECI